MIFYHILWTFFTISVAQNNENNENYVATEKCDNHIHSNRDNLIRYKKPKLSFKLANVVDDDDPYIEDGIYYSDTRTENYFPIQSKSYGKQDKSTNLFQDLDGAPQTHLSSLFNGNRKQSLQLPNNRRNVGYRLVNVDDAQNVEYLNNYYSNPKMSYIDTDVPTQSRHWYNDDIKYYFKSKIPSSNVRFVQTIHHYPKMVSNELRKPHISIGRYRPLSGIKEEIVKISHNPQLIVDRRTKPQFDRIHRQRLIKKIPGYGRIVYFMPNTGRNIKNNKVNYYSKDLEDYPVFDLKDEIEENGVVTEQSIYEDIKTFSIRNPYAPKKTDDIEEESSAIDNKPTTSFQFQKKLLFIPQLKNNNNGSGSNEDSLLLKLKNYLQDILEKWFKKFGEILGSKKDYVHPRKMERSDTGIIPGESQKLVNKSECLNFANPNYAMDSGKKDLQMQFLKLWENKNNPQNNSNYLFFTKSQNRAPNIWLDVSRVFYGDENLTITKQLLHKIFPIDQKNKRNYNNFRYIPFVHSFKSGTGIAYHMTKADFQMKEVKHNSNSSNISEPDNRIIGGEKANIKKYPYQVAIFQNDEFVCGGAIIKDRFVLTAAHCFESLDPKEYSVKAGITHLEDESQTRNLIKIFQHENYVFSDYDIALMLVDKPFEFNTNVAMIRLPDENVCLKVGDVVTVTGYGSTGGISGPLNQDFFAIDLQLTTRERCMKRKLRTIENFAISDKQICTGSPADHGTCHGDSGGPMMINGLLVGVVSWGSPCAIGDPDVFTNVTYFLQWIYNIINRY